MAAPDKGIPEEVLSNAKCILVVPNLIKGGFIIRRQTWPGNSILPHLRRLERARVCIDWRWKLGIADRLEGVDLVVLVMNDRGFQHLLSSKFERQVKDRWQRARLAVMLPPEPTGR